MVSIFSKNQAEGRRSLIRFATETEMVSSLDEQFYNSLVSSTVQTLVCSMAWARPKASSTVPPADLVTYPYEHDL